MTKLQNLTATKTESQTITERRCITSAVHAEIAPGCFLHIHLGNEGLVLGHGEAKVFIPLHELINLTLLHEPSLVPPKPAPSLTAVGVHDSHFTNK